MLVRPSLLSSFLAHSSSFSSANLFVPRHLTFFYRRQYATESKDDHLVHIGQQFEAVSEEERCKKTFLMTVAAFKRNAAKTRGHVEFINTALKYLKPYGVHKDLDVYKALLDVFPKGVMIPRSTFQRISLHYPMQQNCCIKVLDQMEWYGVHPDKEINDIVINAFGDWNFATKKIKRMLYWMPKLRFTNKYLDPRRVDGRNLSDVDLASVALQMMARDLGSSLSYAKVKDKPGEIDGWIVSAQSVLQERMVEKLKVGTTVYVDGPERVYVRDRTVFYFTLTTDPVEGVSEFCDETTTQKELEDWQEAWLNGEKFRKERNINEQRDETILALAVFSNFSKPFATAWINHLQKKNERLKDVRILFRIKEHDKELVSVHAEASAS
ncbi:hypothetical protein AB6A40_005481 [Gnathostoma spinigerum]|uniref:Evolutionarily conserved signaling intermediate in Toll pathway, mitochondrial n=1 Tax=Gnathostoma spinigerum TaxID=75299 RepID=A0ABD6EQD9_9BILA